MLSFLLNVFANVVFPHFGGPPIKYTAITLKVSTQSPKVQKSKTSKLDGQFDSAVAPLTVIRLGKDVARAPKREDHERGPRGPSRMVRSAGFEPTTFSFGG